MNIEAKIDEVLEAYQHKPEMSVREICRVYGVSPASIVTWASIRGIPQRTGAGRPRLNKPNPRHQAILDMVAQHSLEDVAARFSVSKQEIWRVIERWKHAVPANRLAPFRPGDIIRCAGRTYTVCVADLFSGSLVDDEGRYIPRFVWKRSNYVKKVGHTRIDASWYEKK